MEASERIERLLSYVEDIVVRDVLGSDSTSVMGFTPAHPAAIIALRHSPSRHITDRILGGLHASTYLVSPKTVGKRVRMLERAHLLDLILDYHHMNPKDSVMNRTAYVIDQGMAVVVSQVGLEGVVGPLRTAVYLELRNRLGDNRVQTIMSYTVYVQQHRRVDFRAGDLFGIEPCEFYRVVADLGDHATRRRELASLEAAMSSTGVRHATLVTLRDEGLHTGDNGIISIVPAWRWALCPRQGFAWTPLKPGAEERQ